MTCLLSGVGRPGSIGLGRKLIMNIIITTIVVIIIMSIIALILIVIVYKGRTCR